MYSVTTLIVSAILFPLLGVVAVCLRFYVRLRVKPTFIGLDDWMIALSCLLVCASGAAQAVAATLGELGREKDPMDPHRMYIESKVEYAVLIAEKITYSSIKISVLLFYRRIFITPTFRTINTCLTALILIWGIVFLFSEVFLCGSTAHGGNPCASSEWRALWFAITDVITDIAVLVLPYPMIRKLQMDKKEKIGLSAVFALGTLSVIAGIVRLGFVAERFATYFHPHGSDKRANAAPNFWTTFEISIGLLAACLPPLGPLLRRLPEVSRLFSSVASSLGLRSTNAGLSDGIPKAERALSEGWINLPDSHRSGSPAHAPVKIIKKTSVTLDPSDAELVD